MLVLKNKIKHGRWNKNSRNYCQPKVSDNSLKGCFRKVKKYTGYILTIFLLRKVFFEYY